MTQEQKERMIEMLLKSGKVQIDQLSVGDHNTLNHYSKEEQPQGRNGQGEQLPGIRQAVMDYVARLMPVVAAGYREQFTKIWTEILEQEAVSKLVYDRGRQQGTLFNRNLVARITHMMVGGIIVKDTTDVRMAELLEPEKGRNHPVRGELAASPEEKQVKKAVEGVLERHGVKVS